MLTAVVLTHNEQESIARCLTSLKFCDSILVIDDNSTDDTVPIANKYHAEVLSRPLLADFSAQRNFALSRIKTGWVLFVDADEVVSPQLSSEIRQATTAAKPSNAYTLPRLDIMWGQPLKHGDVANVQLVRLAPAGAGSWSGQVHEKWQIKGSVGRLKNPLFHYPHPTLADFLHHLNTYSSLRSQELYHQGQKTNLSQVIFYPLAKFLHLYLLSLGLLDGTAGFIHAMAMAFYTFLVRAKLWWKSS